jgi:membrane protein YqaA with SNARE-associated domain
MVILINLVYHYFLEYHNFYLFLISFLSATILPISSEMILSMIFYKGISKMDALLYATLGNSLACILNYFLGYFVFKTMNQKSLKIFNIKFKLPSSEDLSYRIVQKYHYYAILFSWLPIIGDPITILSGYFKFPLISFILIASFLRFLRYYLLFILFN